MREICEFSTVEEFWRYWSFVPRPSEVLFDGNSRKEIEGRTIDAFSVFKKGIRPEWEDVANRTGSELSCRKTMTVDILDAYWENLVLGEFLHVSTLICCNHARDVVRAGLIGEIVDENDEICGCRVVDKSKKGSNRCYYRLELWLRTANAEVGERIR